jgi:hypothetical protein
MSPGRFVAWAGVDQLTVPGFVTAAVRLIITV